MQEKNLIPWSLLKGNYTMEEVPVPYVKCVNDFSEKTPTVSNVLNKVLKQNIFCTPQNKNFSDICLEKFLSVYFNDRMTFPKKYPFGTFLVIQWLRLCFQWKGHGFEPQLGRQDPTYQVVWPKNRNQNLRSILSANGAPKLNYLLSAFIFS